MKVVLPYNCQTRYVLESDEDNKAMLRTEHDPVRFCTLCAMRHLDQGKRAFHSQIGQVRTMSVDHRTFLK